MQKVVGSNPISRFESPAFAGLLRWRQRSQPALSKLTAGRAEMPGMTKLSTHRDEHEVHDHDLGLAHDLPLLISRRRALGVITGGIGLALAGCGSDEGRQRRDDAEHRDAGDDVE